MVGLALDPLEDNECVSGTTIQAVCYNSVPDLRLLCPKQLVPFGRPGITVDPLSTTIPPVNMVGIASEQNLSCIIPAGGMSSAGTSYNITFGCAQPACYLGALENCFSDLFV